MNLNYASDSEEFNLFSLLTVSIFGTNFKNYKKDGLIDFLMNRVYPVKPQFTPFDWVRQWHPLRRMELQEHLWKACYCEWAWAELQFKILCFNFLQDSLEEVRIFLKSAYSWSFLFFEVDESFWWRKNECEIK